MINVIKDNDVFLSNFNRIESRLSGRAPGWVHRLRTTAIADFAEHGFPTPRQEEWRFTDVKPLLEVAFEAPAAGEESPDVRDLVETCLLTAGSHRLVLVDGRYRQDLSATGALPTGVVLGGLADLLGTRPQLVEPYLGRAVYQDHAFTRLNTAFLDDGLVVYVPPGVTVDEPIHLLSVSTAPGPPAVVHPRVLIVVGRSASATVIEEHVGGPGDVYLTNAVTEITLEENATVDHYKLQREGLRAFHFATIHAHQERDSSFSSHFFSLGGSLVRNETNVVLAAENCWCELDGLYLAGGRQHMDNRTRIDHTKPNCSSRELYKGILGDRSSGVFNGKIFVHTDAQKTDAKQSNQALLLSDNATVNTKPQLEIYADDVKCTHGATIGQLDADALFYLRARGISHRKARQMLIRAFAGEVLDGIRVEAVRTRLDEILSMADAFAEERT